MRPARPFIRFMEATSGFGGACTEVIGGFPGRDHVPLARLGRSRHFFTQASNGEPGPLKGACRTYRAMRSGSPSPLGVAGSARRTSRSSRTVATHPEVSDATDRFDLAGFPSGAGLQDVHDCVAALRAEPTPHTTESARSLWSNHPGDPAPKLPKRGPLPAWCRSDATESLPPCDQSRAGGRATRRRRRR